MLCEQPPRTRDPYPLQRAGQHQFTIRASSEALAFKGTALFFRTKLARQKPVPSRQRECGVAGRRPGVPISGTGV